MHVPTTITAPAGIRPFLKWAGGKRQLLNDLRRFVPERFSAYHEPFLGSGALFFDLWGRGLLDGLPCHLTDVNADLIGCYRALARDASAVISELEHLAAHHARDGAAAYYRVRDDLFNSRRRGLQPESEGGMPYPADLTAMFIYLNRTGYNGLFRLNGRGEFNVPVGRYTNPRICDAATLRAVAGVLRVPRVEVRHDACDRVADRARPGDLVYLDPPYAPLSSTANFTSYTPGSFSEADQRQLQKMVLHLARAGCFVVLSNSTAPLISDLYDTSEARRAGFRTYRVTARRAINSNARRRAAVEEYIISNVEPSPIVPPPAV